MAKANDKGNLPVTFVGLRDDEEAPCFAAYELDSAGQPVCGEFLFLAQIPEKSKTCHRADH